jgi:hypothetical protein
MGDDSSNVSCCVIFGRILRACICACNIVCIFFPCAVPCMLIGGDDCIPPCCTHNGPCDPDGDCCCGTVME